jgi:hypothetical protein
MVRFRRLRCIFSAGRNNRRIQRGKELLQKLGDGGRFFLLKSVLENRLWMCELELTGLGWDPVLISFCDDRVVSSSSVTRFVFTNFITICSSRKSLHQCAADSLHLWHTPVCRRHMKAPQNFGSRKGGIKLYMTINMYLHINPCPLRMQAYENKPQYVWNKTVDGESVCMCIPCIYYEFQLWKMLTHYSLIEKHCTKRRFLVLFK